MTSRVHGGQPRFVVIGAGTAGLLAGIKLREAGYRDVTIYEKADQIGGTWRDNTYPGVACDVPAYLYSYSFAPNPEWSHVFAPGDEIEAYHPHRHLARLGSAHRRGAGGAVDAAEHHRGVRHAQLDIGHDQLDGASPYVVAGVCSSSCDERCLLERG